VTATVTGTAPHHLIADGEPLAVRRTRAGDAWEASQVASAAGAAAEATAPAPVLLGMPTRR
jgi:tRNA-2-methylthio-N6-dimethylallyladenosine synthase